MEAGAGEPTRSMAAQTAAAARRVAARRQAMPNGLWGMALFLCSEVTIFGTLLSSYFYLDFDAPRWPPAGVERPALAWPLIATGWLIATSVPMLVASRAARRGNRSTTVWMITLALVMQACYLAAQIYLFHHDLDSFSPQGSAYGSIYFTILAVHHAHVAVGMVLDLGILWHVGVRGLNNYRLIGVRGLALYWHVVNVLAVFVVLTQVSPSL
ncbi:MAG TPA: cytochrome c oxidase subunit 3 [Solirubrobacteraceae bacterium]|jgi:cytochrome c oxidase subunit 3/cytochrome c oxidase subunit I+III